MLAFFIDYKLKSYEKKIKYAIDYVCSVCGFNYRYILKMSELMPNDILLCYSLNEPTSEELARISVTGITFYIPANFILFDSKEFIKFVKGNPRNYLYEFRLDQKIPVFGEKRFKNPLNRYSLGDVFIGKFNFDFFGNIFFNLNLLEERLIGEKKDAQGKYPDSSYLLGDYTDYPYINALIKLFENFIEEGISVSGQYLLKKEVWPEKEEFAVAVMHSLKSYRKWEGLSIFTAFGKDILKLFSSKYKMAFKNIIEEFKYAFNNDEPYWNFGEMFSIEEEYNINTSYFFKTDFDKSGDKDLYELVNYLKENDHEIGLLASEKSMKDELHKTECERLEQKTDVEIKGVRQVNNFFDREYTVQNHGKADFLYDASLGFSEKSGFKGGIAYPFNFYNFYPGRESKEDDIQQYKQLEIPVIFSDDHLRINEYEYCSYDDASILLRRYIGYIKKFNGLLTLDFNQENFYDISYDRTLYSFALAKIKENNTWVAPLNEIAEWWQKRKRVKSFATEEGIKIVFYDDIKSITFSVKGIAEINSVKGASHFISENKVTFTDVKKKQEAFIILDTPPEAVE
ncbi:MAG: hypothetical protein CSB55_05235 [Candidatus Cloacimonadota bacterium]|nr:MAG: hypothetical protein CSB55_05235 [Candidatus Cloacimonadota bacterium]